MNYLDRLLQRAAGGPEVLRPRTPARFEPPPGTDRASPWSPAVEPVTEVEVPPAATHAHATPANPAPAAPGRDRDGEAAGPAAPVLRPRPGRLLSPATARPMAARPMAARPMAEIGSPVAPGSAVPAARATPSIATPLRPRDPPPLALDRVAQDGPSPAVPALAAIRPGPDNPAMAAAAPPAAQRDAPGLRTPAAREPTSQHGETSEAAREPTITRASDGDTPAFGSWGSDRPVQLPSPHGPTRPVAAPVPAPVTIEIGTIEFRAPPPPAAPAPPPAAPRGPAVSLADYLARRGARRGP